MWIYSTWLDLPRTGIRGRGPPDGGRWQDLPGVGKDAPRFRELLHAPRRRKFAAAKFGEGEGAPPHLPQGFSNGEHGSAEDEPELLFNGTTPLNSLIQFSNFNDGRIIYHLLFRFLSKELRSILYFWHVCSKRHPLFDLTFKKRRRGLSKLKRTSNYIWSTWMLYVYCAVQIWYITKSKYVLH